MYHARKMTTKTTTTTTTITILTMTPSRLRKAVVILAAAALCAAPAFAADAQTPPEEALWSQLRARITEAAGRLDGVAGVFVKDLKTGAVIELRADQVFPQASSIKLTVLYELYRQADEGKIDLGEVMRPPLPRAGGGGVLQELGGDVSLTWRDLAVMMMGWSDNEATNVLIRRLGMPAIGARITSLGLKETRLRRVMMDVAAARRGDENVSTPHEMGRLMELLQQGSGLRPAAAQDMMKVASVTKDSPFRAPFPEEGLPVADKPGSLEGVRCVTAFVALPGRPYIAAIMTTALQRESDGDAFIAATSRMLYEAFGRFAKASAYGRLVNE
jgi:beta-lactamase class A